MSGWRYAWLIVVCSVLAPVTGGLLLAIPYLALNAQTFADVMAGFALFGAFALITGSTPGLASGLLLALLRYRSGQLSLPVVVAAVLSSVAAFVVVLEFFYPGTDHTLEGFLGSLAVMLLPALLSVVAIWFLRGRIGLRALG